MKCDRCKSLIMSKTKMLNEYSEKIRRLEHSLEHNPMANIEWLNAEIQFVKRINRMIEKDIEHLKMGD